ncbi:DUF551 domain-containing protein [Klebsiella pneumoniae]|uniref:DUF551 domain-containing protein n=1 Tax=Klebsiella pneumoniae TaxID=573 RepID=UPI00398815D1
MKFEEWLAQQDGVIEVDCGCVTTEAFYHWMRVAYEAGNFSVVPDCERPIVPCKWIPVSERMPEDRTQVILWDAEIGEVTSGHYSHKTHTFYHCGDAIENEITHWMAPPAAPQEVGDA